MNEKIIKFGDIEIEEYEFYQCISINNIDISKIVVSNQLPFGKQDFKYFIGYKDVKKVNLCIFYLKMSVYRREFDEIKIKFMYFLIEDIYIYVYTLYVYAIYIRYIYIYIYIYVDIRSEFIH